MGFGSAGASMKRDRGPRGRAPGAWGGLPAVGLLLLALAPGGCTGSGRGRPRIAASIFPLYDITRRVAGEELPVQLVLPPGQSEHSFEPKPSDVEGLANAQLIFTVGLGLDPWVQTLVKTAGTGTAKVFELAPLLDPILVPPGILKEEEGAEGTARVDDHFWMDPVRMQQAVELVVEALQRLDPEQSPRFRTRGNEVKRSLALLHEEIARRAGAWTKRRIVTFQGSFLYFADRYHLEIVAVVEPVPGRELDARHRADLLTAIRKGGAVALFSEPQLDPGPAQLLAAETNLPLYELDPLGGGEGDSYEKLLRRDVDVLEKALQ
jgi:ABC-type Zn uptake system ZnuABC Zn-binding protein ZnuA